MRKKISLFSGIARDQRESIAAQGGFRVGLYVEPHFGLAVALVRAVAGVAAVGEDRADIAVVLNLGGGKRRGKATDAEHEDIAMPHQTLLYSAALSRGAPLNRGPPGTARA